MDFALTIDSTSELPLQQQLYEELRQAILERRLLAGQKMPATRELARSLGISRTTVVLTYDAMTSEGYLEAATGSGTYVARELPDEFLRSQAPGAGHEKKVEVRRRACTQRLSKFGRYLHDNELVGPAVEPEINFALGRPDNDEFPIRQWTQLLNKHCKSRRFSELELPKKSQGYLPLRQAIADYLARARDVNVEAERIIIVNGSQQAVDLVTRVLVEHGDHVGLENPCWFGAQTIFEAQGAKIYPVSVDANGLNVEELRGKRVPDLKLVYVTPSHQFPTGVVMSLPRRLELLDWAEKTDTYVIEDDYDSEYRYEGRPIPALSGLDKSESVIYIGTFSKTLFVSLRLGYLIVPPHLVQTFAHAKWMTDRHSPLLEQQVLADFIAEGHFERHIRRMRNIYEQRRRFAIESLTRHFGDRFKVSGDNAGIHMLVKFQTKLSDDEIVRRAQKEGVLILRTSRIPEEDTAEFIICYGSLPEAKIELGVSKLSSAIGRRS
jgi:GntR family transcriptional regulator / MocR family aminotransferase